MFNVLKKKSEPKETKKLLPPTEEPPKKEEIARKADETEPVEQAADTAQQVNKRMTEIEKPFVCVKEYSSVMEITEKMDDEIAQAKSNLGKYLRRLDETRAVAEKIKRVHEAVAKVTNRKGSKQNPDKIVVEGLEIVLDATPINELTAMESVVKSHQQHLLALQKAQEALKTLDQTGDTEGIQYFVLEREGIPEQILLKFS